MATTLLYIGIAIIIIGWLTLSWFASKQINAKARYEKTPAKWEEVKSAIIKKRWAGRVTIVLGMIVIIISLIL